MEQVYIDYEWSGGFRAEFSLTNDGAETRPVSIEFLADAEITNIWNGGVEELSPGHFRLTVEDVDPGETVSGGFTASANHAQIFVLEDGAVEVEPWVITLDPSATAAELQTLIDTAPPGSTITLGAGSYAFDRTVVIARDDIAVVGTGSDDVTINVPSDLGESAFEISGGRRTEISALAEPVAQGQDTLHFATGHGIEAGDHLYLERDNTAAFLAEIGDTQWLNDSSLRTSIVEVDHVDGTTVHLVGGVHFDFDTAETRVYDIDLLEDVVLGGFTVDYGLGAADPSLFQNTLPDYARSAVIEVDGAAGAIITDIAAHDVPSLGLNLLASTELDISGTTFTGAHNKGTGGNGYAIQIRDVYDSTISNHSDADMRHSILFSSWRSAAGNEVHVASTDRDINFHGGRDHDNTVHVTTSIRDADSDVIGESLVINSTGFAYGAPTDIDANTVLFETLVGSRLADDVTGHDGGSFLDGAGGDDTLRGGAGDDSLAGGIGDDSILGGDGVDRAIFSGLSNGYRITGIDGGFEIEDMIGDQGLDVVRDVEFLVFDDAEVDTAAIDAGDESLIEAPVLFGTDGKDVIEVTEEGTLVYAGGGWDRVISWVDFTMSEGLERLDLAGDLEIDATGTTVGDLILANDAANVIRGRSGDDRIFARGGDDRIYGSSGSDEIDAGMGDDTIQGGGGSDTLTGQHGADVFQFRKIEEGGAWGIDTITDFETGDMIDLTSLDADPDTDGNQALAWDPDGGAGTIRQSGDLLEADIDGDGTADFTIRAPGHAFGAVDFDL